MEKQEDIYLLNISRTADRYSFDFWAKELFFRYIPLLKSLGLLVLFGFCALVFQAFTVGAFDRFGISPKTGILATSLFFAAASAGLAVIGGLKEQGSLEVSENVPPLRPICKMLFISKKKSEKRAKMKFEI